jgi:hypothetical protein
VIKEMANESERLQILEMIEKGVITAEEGVRLLNSLQGEPEVSEPPVISSTSSADVGSSPEPEVTVEEPTPDMKSTPTASDFENETRKWRRWWWIPLTVGISITVISGLLMTLAYQNSGFGFWFACLWFPLLLGVIIISLAAASRTTRWLHVRVHQEPGEWPRTIAISLPIPIRFTAWLLRIFKPYIHGMDKTSLDEVILALEKVSPDQPFYVTVDEGESGERVEVYIG